MTQFTQTATRIAGQAGIAPETVRHYADLGLIPHVRTSSGTRLFAAGAVEVVKKIYADRVATRGRRPV